MFRTFQSTEQSDLHPVLSDYRPSFALFWLTVSYASDGEQIEKPMRCVCFELAVSDEPRILSILQLDFCLPYVIWPSVSLAVLEHVLVAFQQRVSASKNEKLRGHSTDQGHSPLSEKPHVTKQPQLLHGADQTLI